MKEPHQVGDKVHIYGVGTFGQYLVTDSEKLTKIQNDLSLEEVAPHLINPTTAVQMARVVGKDGHKAAIHTAGSLAGSDIGNIRELSGSILKKRGVHGGP